MAFWNATYGEASRMWIPSACMMDDARLENIPYRMGMQKTYIELYADYFLFIVKFSIDFRVLICLIHVMS